MNYFTADLAAILHRYKATSLQCSHVAFQKDSEKQESSVCLYGHTIVGQAGQLSFRN